MADGLIMGQPIEDDELDRLIAVADLDNLVRLVDTRTSNRDWDGLFRLRERARSAVLTGRQLWPAATLAEHRLALYADPTWACRVLDEESGRFAIGPLTEVIAQNHPWSDLSPHLPHGPRRAFIAYERAIVGDRIDESIDEVLDIPVQPADWEPPYVRTRYHDFGIENPSPLDGVDLDWRDIAEASDFEPIDDPWVERALHSLIEPWKTSSNGRAESTVVAGTVDDALHALGTARGRLAPIEPDLAMAWLAWCGASGGAHGRRRGAATGRFGAWWMLAAIGGLTDDWDELRDSGDLSDEIGSILVNTQWWCFDDGDRSAAYQLSLLAGLSDDDPESESATPLGVALLARDHPSLG
ncbi:MAG: hypothetical protein RL391_677 [Actinomycetota bacterium]|jgi:hypothetical protein